VGSGLPPTECQSYLGIAFIAYDVDGRTKYGFKYCWQSEEWIGVAYRK
jgi:hypothetical protein